MIYITEKQRFYSKTWLGAKKLEGVQAYVMSVEHAAEDVYYRKTLESGDVILGNLREYSVASWKELMLRPDVFYRGSADEEFYNVGLRDY